MIARLGQVPPAEMWQVFNMGCGFVAMVAPAAAEAAVALLAEHHPGVAVIGQLTEVAGRIEVPELGLEGDADGLRGPRHEPDGLGGR
jgi:phosphoribosylformylglycinamidine cyclo-ligase